MISNISTSASKAKPTGNRECSVFVLFRLMLFFVRFLFGPKNKKCTAYDRSELSKTGKITKKGNKNGEMSNRQISGKNGRPRVRRLLKEAFIT